MSTLFIGERLLLPGSVYTMGVHPGRVIALRLFLYRRALTIAVCVTYLDGVISVSSHASINARPYGSAEIRRLLFYALIQPLMQRLSWGYLAEIFGRERIGTEMAANLRCVWLLGLASRGQAGRQAHKKISRRDLAGGLEPEVGEHRFVEPCPQVNCRGLGDSSERWRSYTGRAVEHAGSLLNGASEEHDGVRRATVWGKLARRARMGTMRSFGSANCAERMVSKLFASAEIIETDKGLGRELFTFAGQLDVRFDDANKWL